MKQGWSAWLYYVRLYVHLFHPVEPYFPIYRGKGKVKG